jgi:hypothetical protein
LNEIFGNRDASGRIGKWAMKLSEHVVDFEKRSAIKLQVLVDFITDWTEPSTYTEGTVVDMPWQVYCDGAWEVARAGATTIVIPRSEKKGTKPPYVCPGCSNHTHDNN